MLPRVHCAHPEGRPLPDVEKLRFVWFEEGDGVALLEGDDILAIVPVWPGVDFSGYARDCVSESTLCWPLLTDNVLRERVRASEDYWRWWDSSPWSSFQPAALAAIEAHLGTNLRYFAIDGDEWPPKAMVMAENDVTTMVTLGVGLRAQPAIDPEDAHVPRRIELAFAAGRSAIDSNRVAQYISGQTNLPWRHVTFLDDGHTIPCDAFPRTDFEFVLLQKNPPGVPRIKFDAIRGQAVELLWMIPITAPERKFAEEKGSAELANRLRSAGASGVFADRRDAVRSRLLSFFRR